MLLIQIGMSKKIISSNLGRYPIHAYLTISIRWLLAVVRGEGRSQKSFPDLILTRNSKKKMKIL